MGYNFVIGRTVIVSFFCKFISRRFSPNLKF